MNGNIIYKEMTHPSGGSYTFLKAGQTFTNITYHKETMTYNAQNQLLKRVEAITGEQRGQVESFSTLDSFWYTDNGSVRRKFEEFGYNLENIYEYNAREQLVKYSYDETVGGTYTYDAEGYRASKTVGGVTTRFYWDRGFTCNESDGTNFTAKNTIGNGGIVSRKLGTATPMYLMKDVHGDTTAVLQSGSTVGTYDYDAFGKQLTSSGTVDNPYRYCGEYIDGETGFIYLRNRYYDPRIGRFMSEDPAKSGLNWYVYCENNPLKFVDPWGLTSWQDASEIIKNNADYINAAGAYYNVNPAIIAACIYTEQIKNVNWVDSLTDVPGFWMDTSVGIGQVKISTAKMLEDNGYIAKTEFKRLEVIGNMTYSVWSTPGTHTGEVYANSREEAISYRLSSDGENVNYVAAYLAYWQDVWRPAYPQIDGHSDILGTLYNLGDRANPPNTNPKPNPFGENVKKEYHYMQKLLGHNH